MLLSIRQDDCNHEFIETTKEWDILIKGTDDSEARKRNMWHYCGDIEKCAKCGREELRGGTILVPEGGDFFGGEYALEQDGSRGMFIG